MTFPGYTSTSQVPHAPRLMTGTRAEEAPASAFAPWWSWRNITRRCAAVRERRRRNLRRTVSLDRASLGRD